MPLLIIEHVGKVYAGVISGRVVIGRRPEDQIRLADKTIGRIHAWIDAGEDGKFFIADAGSKAGTFVNDERVVVRKALHSNDRIRIGPLSVRLVEGRTIPPGAASIDLRMRPSPPPTPDAGISFDCKCGAPFWVPWTAAGKTGNCRSCGNAITVPQPLSAPARTTSQPGVESSCGICHGAIRAKEEKTHCPACNALFHIECWTENGGCSVYGCSQVSVLRALPQSAGDLNNAIAAAFIESGSAVADEGTHARSIPWAYGLLAASVLAAVAGTLTFGGTSLLMAAAALLFLFRNKATQQRKIVFLSIGVSMTGALAGLAVSYYWWMGGIPWHPTR